MKEVFIDHKLYIKSFENKSNEEAYIFFHGFPGPSGTDENSDQPSLVGELIKLFEEKEISFFIPHYSGIEPSKGNFSFYNSFSDSFKAINYVKSLNYKKISFIGRSWGAYIAVNAFHNDPDSLENLILLTPYIQIPEEDEVLSILTSFYDNYPQILNWKQLDSHVSEVLDIGQFIDTFEQAGNISPKKTLIISSKYDELVDESLVKDFFESFSSTALHFSLYDDHSIKKLEPLIKILKAQI